MALCAAAVFFVACLFLGRWQYGRYEDRQYHADLVHGHYTAEPVPLDQVLPAGSPPLPEDQVWRRVEVTGTYAADARQMVRNRPQNVAYGFEVLDPLVLPGGDAVLVDRGWAPNAERADLLPDVPPAPSGQVRVIGWLRQGEAQLDRDMPAGQLASIDLRAASAATGLTLRPAYLVLDQERTADGATPARPQPLIPPSTDTGPHFAYALQWWGASPVGFVLVFVYARREYEELTEGEPDGVDGDSGREGDGRPLASAGATRRSKPKKPKKVRIWDEEDG